MMHNKLREALYLLRLLLLAILADILQDIRNEDVDDIFILPEHKEKSLQLFRSLRTKLVVHISFQNFLCLFDLNVVINLPFVFDECLHVKFLA